MRPDMIKNAHDLIADMQKNFKEIDFQSKDTGESFKNFLDKVFKDNHLDTKTKALIAIALSVLKQCKWCITYSVNLALENGATKEQIHEAGWVAVSFGGFSAYTYMQILTKSLNDLAK
ncbi:MAG: carboxymuconolactone decarboxylase family protein [Desulfurella sp.]|uniref:Alkylhydroperoxidase AhpD family core domain-containing protein n=1 Tax=Desulfurella multipotens TaxID=79269 RepID=A0A1G6K4F2_9BACT|nr:MULTISPECIES: carboxymuconolactone decarboxylase family protein [Desulfurella]PMP90432.1 MAG: carboxymuconolactone decarboxylase family protein [Desulfurella sp.]SDC25880.1 alkylhydroperoxidase AhpD family core domain-containing protein [Desulfurella multipotens]